MQAIKRKVGRPRIDEKTRNLVVRLYNQDELTCDQIAKACGIGRTSVFRIINERSETNGEKE